MAKALKLIACSFTACLFFVLGGVPKISQAASLLLSPYSGTTTVGTPFNVTVVLNTNGVVANAVDVAISFPTDKLKVNSISKSGSVIGLWVTEPAYSNAAGTVTFTGGTPRPGFIGPTLTLATITFVPLATGMATIVYTGNSVLSGDGLGTELLSGLGTATFTQNPAPPPPPPAPPAPPPAPVIVYVPVPAPPAPVAPPPEPVVCPAVPVCVVPTEPIVPTETPTTSPPASAPTPVSGSTPGSTPTSSPTSTPAAPSPTPTSIARVAASVQTVTKTVYVNAKQTYADIQTAPVTQATADIATPVAVAATAASAIGLAAAVDLLPLLQYLATAPLVFFRRRTRKNYGVVYDAYTKVPTALATVRLYSLTGHRLIASAVTDLLGRYNLLAEPGSYFVEVAKGGFTFPSQSLMQAKDDGQFLDVYHGEILKVTEANASINVNVPLDRAENAEALLTPAKVRAQNLIKKIRENAGMVGLGLSFGVFLVRPGILTGALFIVQLIVYGVVKRLGTPNKPTGWGIVYDAASGQPVHNAAVRVFDYQNNKLLQTGITDQRGRYTFMLGPNQYVATIEKTGYEPASIKPIDLRFAKDVVPLTNHIALHQSPNAAV